MDDYVGLIRNRSRPPMCILRKTLQGCNSLAEDNAAYHYLCPLIHANLSDSEPFDMRLPQHHGAKRYAKEHRGKPLEDLKSRAAFLGVFGIHAFTCFQSAYRTNQRTIELQFFPCFPWVNIQNLEPILPEPFLKL